MNGSLVIGADGINSKVRACIPANADIEVSDLKEHTFRAVVSRADMDSDPETAKIMSGTDTIGKILSSRS